MDVDAETNKDVSQQVILGAVSGKGLLGIVQALSVVWFL